VGYQVGIDTGTSAHPGFAYATLAEARDAVENALTTELFQAASVVIFTGPGTIYQIVSDEFLKAPMRPKLPADGFLLIAQVRGLQMPPCIFPNEDSMQRSLASALQRRILEHSNNPLHEHTSIHLDRGCVLIPMSAADFIKRQQEALAEHMRKQHEAKPLIVVPGGRS